MKRVWAWMAALALALSAGGCASSNQDYYERAQRYLGCGDYATAAALFGQLGEYRASAEYELYCEALWAMEQGDLTLARADLEAVDPFKSSGRYLRYLDAKALQEDGDLAGALAEYEAMGSFADCTQLAAALREAIPLQQLSQCQTLIEAGHYAQALGLLEEMRLTDEVSELMDTCRQGLQKLQYDQACALYDEGRYEEALAAFEAMGDSLDAPARMMLCRSAMYRQAVSTVPTMENARGLMEDFFTLEDYLDSAEHLQALEARYGVNLRLAEADVPGAVVALGAYPTRESGAPEALTWQVIGVEGATAMLLCQSVIDAAPLASATDLAIDWGGAEAAVESGAPAEADIAGLTADCLRAPATPYALAQGVRHHADGSAWWWLRDQPASGRAKIVWYNGTVLPGGVDAAETVVGVRPLLRVDLNRLFLTAGSGTREDPFRP